MNQPIMVKRPSLPYEIQCDLDKKRTKNPYVADDWEPGVIWRFCSEHCYHKARENYESNKKSGIKARFEKSDQTVRVTK